MSYTLVLQVLFLYVFYNIHISHWESVIPVDAATAPISIDGVPNTNMQKAAAKDVIWAVAEEEADKVLWW